MQTIHSRSVDYTLWEGIIHEESLSNEEKQ